MRVLFLCSSMGRFLILAKTLMSSCNRMPWFRIFHSIPTHLADKHTQSNLFGAWSPGQYKNYLFRIDPSSVRINLLSLLTPGLCPLCSCQPKHSLLYWSTDSFAFSISRPVKASPLVLSLQRYVCGGSFSHHAFRQESQLYTSVAVQNH